MGSEIYIALNKFDNFTRIKGESTKELIDRYCVGSCLDPNESFRGVLISFRGGN